RDPAPTDADHDGGAGPRSHQGSADVRRGLRTDWRWSRHRHDADGAVHLLDRLRLTDPALRVGGCGERRARRGAAPRHPGSVAARARYRRASGMSAVMTFLGRRRGRKRPHVTDVLTYLYLVVGVLVMFGPVAWLVLSSFKTQSALVEFPPSVLPTTQVSTQVEGYDQPLLLFDVAMPDGTTQRLAQVRRIGIEAQMVDPVAPGDIIRVPIGDRAEVRQFKLAWENYLEPLQRFNFLSYLRNSVVVTVVATLITLIINSMAAFALSKYRFRGRNAVFIVIIGTLMIPLSVILVPVYLVITQIGWVNNLWGVIIPGAATPTGVFLLRQYMLTIPDQLIDAARIDGAS